MCNRLARFIWFARRAVLALPLLLAWPGGQAFLAGPQPPAAAVSAEKLLRTYQCGACHRIEGVAGAAGELAPPLAGWGRRSYIAGQIPNTPALLARWIADAPALLPGTTMPALGVPAADAQAMAAHLLAQR